MLLGFLNYGTKIVLSLSICKYFINYFSEKGEMQFGIIFRIFAKNNRLMLSAEAIKDIMIGEGFDLCGITPVRVFADQRAFYEGWLERGYGGSLDYMKRNVDKRFDAGLLVPGARSIIVCGVSYKNDTSMGYGESCVPKIASYARAADYHTTIKSMLRAAAAKLEEQYGAFGWRAFTDSAPVLEKRAAAEAGLGWIGRNTLLVSPRFGSFVLLGELIIDCEVDVYDTPLAGAGCGNCSRCTDACPNNALTSEGIDTRKCIACMTIEKGDTPDSASTHGWLFGCDECQSVCPHNASAPMYSNPLFAPLFDPREITIEDWQAQAPEQFRRTPLTRKLTIDN
jgi:epoxyqueuosine reductase